jgi:cell division protein FtsW
MVLMLVFIGKYPLKYIGIILGAGIVGLTFFILVAKSFSRCISKPCRYLDEARIEISLQTNQMKMKYQIEKAKIAIASGGIYGLGPGKSVQKNFLPQSSSDFIYAIIVEEYGLFGGLLFS